MRRSFNCEIVAKLNFKLSEGNFKIAIFDSMLGKYARWCRMLGLKVLYISNFKDEDLVKNTSIVVTRDKQLYKQRNLHNLPTILLFSSEFSKNLATLIKLFKLNCELNPEKSYCTECGSELIKKTEIDNYILENIPENILRNVKTFWICTKCGKIYWIGSHHKKIQNILNNVKIEILKLEVIQFCKEFYVIYLKSLKKYS